MPYTPNYAPGDVLTAAAMNSIGEAWTAFTPTWTAATTNPVLGNGTISGRYSRNNKLMVARYSLNAGTTTTFGTGAWRFSLPVTGQSGYGAGDPVGFGWVNDGLTTYAATVTIVTTSTVQINYYATSLNVALFTAVTGTDPFTFGNGDGARFEVIYEAA